MFQGSKKDKTDVDAAVDGAAVVVPVAVVFCSLGNTWGFLRT